LAFFSSGWHFCIERIVWAAAFGWLVVGLRPLLAAAPLLGRFAFGSPFGFGALRFWLFFKLRTNERKRSFRSFGVLELKGAAECGESTEVKSGEATQKAKSRAAAPQSEASQKQRSCALKAA